MGTLFIMMGVLVVFIIIQSTTARKRQAKHTQQLQQQLTPGAWVMTTAGFYGQFVEQDGEVVILQTVDGTETFWSQRAVAQVVDEPPFAAPATVAADDDLAPTAAAGAGDLGDGEAAPPAGHDDGDNPEASSAAAKY